MELTSTILDYIKDHSEEAYELLITLGQIPAPSNHEEKRAEFCKNWLEEQGAKGVYIDEALNVVYPVGVTDDNPVVVFMAHTDVVFPDITPLKLVVEDGKIKAPGIGDDTANLVALMMVAKYITQNNLTPANGGMLIVANAGEEGLGNLKGSRQICKDFGERISTFYSFDGYYEGMCNDAVGSMRYQVEILTEGGHSFGAFGNRNAIAYLASMIQTLYEIKVPVTREKTTYNVGMINGGTSVNTIAQQAEMLYEFRSDSKEDLAFMDKHFKAVVESYKTKGIEVNVKLLGERPCASPELMDQDKHKALSEQVFATLKKHIGADPEIHASSTDANIPLSIGIPAVTLGTCSGGGAHTREEWVEISSLEPGYKIAFELMLAHY